MMIFITILFSKLVKLLSIEVKSPKNLWISLNFLNFTNQTYTILPIFDNNLFQALKNYRKHYRNK